MLSRRTKEKKVSRTGAQLVRYALEQLPISHTFGVPGVHNTELYDTLSASKKINPILVTHEASASFMADGISRTSDEIGCLLLVPAAGVTHALSGIAEAFLDRIPMLIISGGIRRDTSHSFKLHEWDQHAVLEPTTKKTYLIEDPSEIVETIYEAYRTATEGVPGPVFVEIPVNIQMFKTKVPEPQAFEKELSKPVFDVFSFERALQLIKEAKQPGMFVGWGAKEASQDLQQLAETLGAPVSTTLQGLSVFPANHPLHVGMGFGAYSVPAAKDAFSKCDLLIAIGTSFSEIPTGSFSMKVPKNLIHIDINPEVFNKNYKASVCLEGDAKDICSRLNNSLAPLQLTKEHTELASEIKKLKESYKKEWEQHKGERVNPYFFIKAFREQLHPEGIAVADDGNHTFLMAELFETYHSKSFISPTDFNCMGYAIPAAIGAQLANPNKEVACVVGDGAYLMSFIEILTAYKLDLGIVFCVFCDGELSQIAQGQKAPYNKKTCTVLGELNIKGTADATLAQFYKIEKDEEISETLRNAFSFARTNKKPVVVDVKVDYTKQTCFTKGVLKSSFRSFPRREKFRFASRAVWRRLNPPAQDKS